MTKPWQTLLDTIDAAVKSPKTYNKQEMRRLINETLMEHQRRNVELSYKNIQFLQDKARADAGIRQTPPKLGNRLIICNDMG